MKLLKGATRRDFISQAKWYVKYLPLEEQNLLIYKWFNTKTNISFDILNWGNGFDYAVAHPFKNEVYLTDKTSETYFKEFDHVLSLGIIRASALYNQLKP